MKKIIIVDDNEKFRDAFKFLINTIDNVDVIAEAKNGIECLKLLDEYVPDLIFMDVEMLLMDGIEATKIINRKYPKQKIVGLSFHDDFELKENLILAGAKGFICKNKLNKEVIQKAIINGDTHKRVV